ncbi:MAG: hypothetical protein LBK60_12775 [Verrucomicrobiales bacterium]|jgi:hypothetical protein|nr:hypothetical protein [Verrucomicrobiales bacterium]
MNTRIRPLLLTILTVSVWNIAAANPHYDDTEFTYEDNPGVRPNGNRVYQDHAPEYLQLKILDVQSVKDESWFRQGQSHITVQAEIIQVQRSASGVRPGQRIDIHYQRKNSIGPGDPQPTVPIAGAITPAFLRKNKDTAWFIPAGRQYTFVPLTQEQAARLAPPAAVLEPAATATPLPRPAGDIQLHPEEPAAAPAPASSVPQPEADEALPTR